MAPDGRRAAGNDPDEYRTWPGLEFAGPREQILDWLVLPDRRAQARAPGRLSRWLARRDAAWEVRLRGTAG